MIIRHAGGLFKCERESKGMTQEEFSEGVCSRAFISQVENGKRDVSSVMFDKLCKKIGIQAKQRPIFKSLSEYSIAEELSQVRLYLSVGNYNEAYNRLLLCNTINEEKDELKVEFLMLSFGVIAGITGNALLGVKYVELSYEILELNTSRNFIFYNTLEYEVLAYHTLFLYNGDKIEKLDEIATGVDLSPLTDREKNYLKMTIYASISLSYRNIGDQENARRYGVFSHEYAIKSGCYYYMLDIYGTAYPGDDFNWSIRDLYNVFGKYSDFNKADISKLEKLALSVRRESASRKQNESVYFSDIIKSLVIRKKHLTKEMLYRGVCTKEEFLDYIYERKNMPALLCQLFLERAGTSSDVFVFWGSKKEEVFNILRTLDFKKNVFPSNQINSILFELEDGPDTKLYEQILMMYQADFERDYEKRLRSLWKAFYLTINESTSEDFENYALSWMELMILNDIAYVLIRLNRASEAASIMERVLKYYKRRDLDITFASSVFPKSVMLYVSALYKCEEYATLVNTIECKQYDIFLYDLDSAATVLSCYGKAKDELSGNGTFAKKAAEVINKSFHRDIDPMSMVLAEL